MAVDILNLNYDDVADFEVRVAGGENFYNRVFKFIRPPQIVMNHNEIKGCLFRLRKSSGSFSVDGSGVFKDNIVCGEYDNEITFN